MPKEVCGETQIASHNITVILLAYNEEVSIGSVVLLARRYGCRVIVFDDCSDRTAGVAANAGLSVVHIMNKGKRMDFKTGFETVESA